MVKLGDSLKVNRDDILDFPEDTVKIVIDIQKKGWRAQRSNRNHIMLLAPDGVTRLSVSRNKNSATYLSEDLRKYERSQGKVNTVVPAKKITQKWPCPKKECNRTFNTEENLTVHIGVDHEGLIKCPDCNEMFKRANVLGIHRSRKHGYVSPKYAKRKELETKRAATKEAKEKVLEAFPELKSEDVVGDIVGSEELTGRHRVNSEKYDPNLLFTKVPETPMFDTVSAESLAPHASSLKSLVSQVEDLSFIDDRDSWTINIEDIREMRIQEIEAVLKAAGLNMEIRVWKNS